MDLQWTQAKWNKLFQRIGIVTSVWYLCQRIRDELAYDNILIEEYWDPIGKLDTWAITDCRLDVDTDKEGLSYVKIVDSAPNWDIEIYKDSALGAPDKVASGSIAQAAPGAVTLVAEIDCFFAGTVETTVNTAADTTIWLRPKIGLLKQIDDMDVEETFDTLLKESMMGTLTNIGTNLATAMDTVEAFVSRQLLPYVANKIKSPETSASRAVELNTDGVISRELRGYLKDLVDAMNDESVAGAQGIDYGAIDSRTFNVVVDPDSAGALGTGLAYPSTWAAWRYARSGIATLECVDETIGAEQFSVKMRTDEGLSITAKNRLTMYKAWLSLDIGIMNVFLVNGPSDSGGEANHFSSWQFSGLSAVNTDVGVLYGKYTVLAPKLIELFKDSGRAAADLVASGTWDGVDGSVVILAEENSSGLTGKVTVSQVAAADPLDTATLEVDINRFRLDDRIYFELSELINKPKFNTFFGWAYGVTLPSDALGDPGTISDEYADRAYSGLRTE